MQTIIQRNTRSSRLHRFQLDDEIVAERKYPQAHETSVSRALPPWRRILAITGTALTLLFLTWLVLGLHDLGSTAPLLVPPAPLAVTSWHWAHNTLPGLVSIEGIVTNPSAKHYRYAQVSFNLYDKHGNQVGSTLANVNNLEAYGTWKFHTLLVSNAHVETGKSQGVIGF